MVGVSEAGLPGDCHGSCTIWRRNKRSVRSSGGQSEREKSKHRFCWLVDEVVLRDPYRCSRKVDNAPAELAFPTCWYFLFLVVMDDKDADTVERLLLFMVGDLDVAVKESSADLVV